MQPPNDIAELSILGWLLKHGISNEKGERLDWRDRLFLLDILTDWSQTIVIKKCSQVGGSVVFNLKALFALKTFGWNIIYTMPTDSDVEEFVKTKTNEIIKNNKHVFDTSSDNVYLKQFGDRNLFFKGTVSKTAAISTSADLLIHDEASRSDQTTLITYKSRLKASRFKGRWLFSNPTTEKDAIDEAWKKSDQKEWEITCTGCTLSQLLKWPQSIDIARRCYQCQGCKKELTREERRLGKWVAQRPGAAISGYHISHLMAPWISAGEIIDESEGDQEYFYNFVLGEPYNPGDLRVSAATILDNWTPRDLSKGKEWYLGVDVGNIKHWVLGTELGITKVGRLTKWQELDDLMNFYDPTLTIDAMPDNTMARYYVDKYPKAQMSFFQENKNNPKTIVWWGENDKQGIVYSNRNRILDQLIDYILNAKMLFGLASDAELKRYLRHWETLRRVKVVDTKGIESYEWQSTTGEDHFVFATLYYYLALLGRGGGSFLPERKLRERDFIGNNNVVGTLEDLSQAMADANNW